MVSEGLPPPHKQQRGCFVMKFEVFLSRPRINDRPHMAKLNALCNPINKLEAARDHIKFKWEKDAEGKRDRWDS